MHGSQYLSGSHHLFHVAAQRGNSTTITFCWHEPCSSPLLFVLGYAWALEGLRDTKCSEHVGGKLISPGRPRQLVPLNLLLKTSRLVTICIHPTSNSKESGFGGPMMHWYLYTSHTYEVSSHVPAWVFSSRVCVTSHNVVICTGSVRRKTCTKEQWLKPPAVRIRCS